MSGSFLMYVGCTNCSYKICALSVPEENFVKTSIHENLEVLFAQGYFLEEWDWMCLNKQDKSQYRFWLCQMLYPLLLRENILN